MERIMRMIEVVKVVDMTGVRFSHPDGEGGGGKRGGGGGPGGALVLPAKKK